MALPPLNGKHSPSHTWLIPAVCLHFYIFSFSIELDQLLLSGDTYGKFLALFTMLPFAIVVAFTALTLFIRDVHVVSHFQL